MEIFDYTGIALNVAILGFLWGLHRDIASLRERMARMEGAVDLLTKFLMNRESSEKHP